MSVNDNPLTDAQMQRITRALSDPQRFAILERIAKEREVACKRLVSEFPITQATISHHLKELVAADLIQSRRVGQCAMLSRRDAVLEEYLRQLNQRLLPLVSPNPSLETHVLETHSHTDVAEAESPTAAAKPMIQGDEGVPPECY
jgi:ArsR family transcriptional regulator, arsenate/arsenite/antimonite-responsive transcriptional repressor